MDKIRITRLEISARIGVYDWERQLRQRLLIDLEFDTDAGAAAAHDNLGDAVDYSGLAARVREIVTGSDCRLIETLAELIARRVLNEYAVPRIKVIVHKPSAVAGASDTSIEIERLR